MREGDHPPRHVGRVRLMNSLERLGIAALDAVFNLHATGAGSRLEQLLVDRVDPRHHRPSDIEPFVRETRADPSHAVFVHRHGVVHEVEVPRSVIAMDGDQFIDDVVRRTEAELLAEQPAGAVGTSGRTPPRREDIAVQLAVVVWAEVGRVDEVSGRRGKRIEIGDRRPRLVVFDSSVGCPINEALHRVDRCLAKHGPDRFDEGRFSFAHHDGVESMFQRFVGQQRRMRSSGDELRATPSQTCGKLVRLFHQGRQERYANNVRLKVGGLLDDFGGRAAPTGPRSRRADAPHTPPLPARPPASSEPWGNHDGSGFATEDRRGVF